ncbi:MAG TPA: DUF4395 family protein [Armatimonadota bacterium]|jgi:hypothetical protein
MLPTKAVSVSKGAFAFCRYSLMVLVWVAFFLRSKELVVLAAVIMALSALLTVRRAPMIVLYNITLEKLFPSGTAVLDEYGMRFAHTFAAIMLGAAAGFAYAGLPHVGGGILFFVAIAKTVSAFGFCPASKAYTCLSRGGSCCGIMKSASCEVNLLPAEPVQEGSHEPAGQ